MKQANTIVVIKPDALETVVSCDVVKALFLAFANHLCQKQICKLSTDMSEIADRAEKQTFERSLTEVSFQGTLNTVDLSVPMNFIQKAAEMSGDQVCVVDVIVLGLQTMDCDIIGEHRYTLKEHDLNEIYSLKDENNEANLIDRLYDYLCNRDVILVKLHCKYGEYLIQHWKTFVRRFLILNRSEKSSLINLIHVCENDFAYVNKLF